MRAYKSRHQPDQLRAHLPVLALGLALLPLLFIPTTVGRVFLLALIWQHESGSSFLHAASTARTLGARFVETGEITQRTSGLVGAHRGSSVSPTILARVALNLMSKSGARYLSRL